MQELFYEYVERNVYNTIEGSIHYKFSPDIGINYAKYSLQTFYNEYQDKLMNESESMILLLYKYCVHYVNLYDVFMSKMDAHDTRTCLRLQRQERRIVLQLRKILTGNDPETEWITSFNSKLIIR